MSDLKKRNRRKTLISKKQTHTRKNGKRKQRRFQKQLHSKKYRGGKGFFDLNPDLTDKRFKGIQSCIPLYKGYAWVKKSILDGGFNFNRRQVMIIIATTGPSYTPAMFIIKCMSDHKCSTSQTNDQQLASYDTKFKGENDDDAHARWEKKETFEEKNDRLAKLKIHQITDFKSNSDGSFQYTSRCIKSPESTEDHIKFGQRNQDKSGCETHLVNPVSLLRWTQTEAAPVEKATYTIKLEQAPNDEIDDDPDVQFAKYSNLMDARFATNSLKMFAELCTRDGGINTAITTVFSLTNSSLLQTRNANVVKNIADGLVNNPMSEIILENEEYYNKPKQPAPAQEPVQPSMIIEAGRGGRLTRKRGLKRRNTRNKKNRIVQRYRG
jgi:hypothetical protein